jgi:fructoselysine-6-P-deglycase FrlB-like protein
VTDRAALLERDILRSAASLGGVLDAYEASDARVDIPPGAPVRFVGLGSSRFASLVVAAELRPAGRAASVEPASAARAPWQAGEWLLAVSSSGRTPETVEVARRGPPGGTVAVTNDPGSPLAEAADTVLPLSAGAERSGIATLTYRATLATLALATGAVAIPDLRAAIDAIDTLVGGRAAWLEAVVDALDAAESIDVVVDAARVGAAEQAALMLREAPRLRAEAREAGEWSHTAIYTALPGHRVVLLGPGRYQQDVATTVAGRGGTVVGIGVSIADAVVTVPLPVTLDVPIGRALVESVAVELAAATLWARAG